MSIDEHPLRYSKVTREIEAILLRRALEGRLDGYTLETAIEIAEQTVLPHVKIPPGTCTRRALVGGSDT